MRAAREEAARMAAPPTPSPMSTDELLPSCSKLEVIIYPVLKAKNTRTINFFQIYLQDDPLGFSSSVLSVKSGTTPRENSIPEFPEKLSPCSSTILRH